MLDLSYGTNGIPVALVVLCIHKRCPGPVLLCNKFHMLHQGCSYMRTGHVNNVISHLRAFLLSLEFLQ